MQAILGTMLLAAIFGYMAWLTCAKDVFKKTSNKTYLVAVLALGFVVRLIAASSYRGHETDMNCFVGWADMAFSNGLSQFYLSEGFHDYPPGYVYVLYVLGAIKQLFSLKGPILWVVLKLPAIVCDLCLGYMAYNLTTEKFSKLAGTVVCAFVVLNPTVILNSSLWGQVDSVLALFCVMSIYLAAQHKLGKSFFVFAAALLIKPQAIFFAPVLLFGFIDEFFLRAEFDKRRFINTILCGVGAVAMLLVLFMPFGNTPIEGISVILNQYISTIGQYNYMTINAFNLYGALGQNWTELTAFASVLGYVFIVAVVIFSAFMFFRNEGKERYFFTAFILVFGIYMLSVKMHERYAFPGIFMLIMAVAISPTNKNMLTYGLFSLSQFFNIAWVLFVYESDTGAYYKSPVIIVASLINLLLFAWVVYGTNKKIRAKSKSETESKPAFKTSEKFVRITAFDISAMLVITAIYGGIAFYKLGDRFSPETYTEITTQPITIDLGEEQEISSTAFYLGARHLESNRNITLSYLDNNGISVYNDIIDDGSVFVWTLREDNPVTARYVEISTNSDDVVYMNELCFIDVDGAVITPQSFDGGAEMFDEQEYLDTEKSYMSGTYFDEIYHPRTAYEFLHHLSVYEWTHPPLGKVLMGIGIALFGMTPFGWRFVGTLLGVVMVPIVYLIARRMFKYRWLSVQTCLLYTFDFMHFTQTRLATIDTYVTLFIMLMYYYMYKYYKKSFYDMPLHKTFIPLGLSGIFFGLSVASKWTGIYAGVGLALIFFITIYDRWREYKYALLSPDGETNSISHKFVIDSFAKNTVKTLLYCCLMFIAVPFAIYTLSYIPYLLTPSGEGLKTIFINAEQMLTYHGKTVVDSTHAYSSYWYEWPIMYRPLWYYANTLDNGLKQGISAFGNPAVWWIGIGAVAYNMALAIIIPLRRKNYFNKNKYLFAVAYGLIFAILTILAGLAGMSNEKLTRLLPCVMLYSVIIVGTFIITMMYDDRIKETSNRIPLFLLIGYFSGYMPWILVLRTTYIYHYFPCVVFVVLMIGYSIKTFYENVQNKKTVIVGATIYTLVAVGLFILFYPVISGQPVSLDFAEQYLKWFKSWVLVA